MSKPDKSEILLATASLQTEIKSHTMKKLITNSNPFILLLLPVLFALIMGVSYQFQQKRETIVGTSVRATSLFYKGVTLVKTVCSIAEEKLW
jgi:cytochrome c biogenesis protein CcdA